MLPIGLLMIEHRVIERLIALMQKEGDRILKDKLADIDFIDDCLDFIRTYADRCHHGKEEEILFRDLKDKKLSIEHLKILNELVDEHKLARGITSKLVEARNKYFNDVHDTTNQIYSYEIYEYLKELIDFYPKHIRKEDKNFFLPCMNYFTVEEKEKMLEEFLEFDRKLIHEKYKKVIEKYE
jgi:hemerythrin-like domain-containing protein